MSLKLREAKSSSLKKKRGDAEGGKSCLFIGKDLHSSTTGGHTHIKNAQSARREVAGRDSVPRYKGNSSVIRGLGRVFSIREGENNLGEDRNF